MSEVSNEHHKNNDDADTGSKTSLARSSPPRRVRNQNEDSSSTTSSLENERRRERRHRRRSVSPSSSPSSSKNSHRHDHHRRHSPIRHRGYRSRSRDRTKRGGDHYRARYDDRRHYRDRRSPDRYSDRRRSNSYERRKYSRRTPDRRNRDDYRRRNDETFREPIRSRSPSRESEKGLTGEALRQKRERDELSRDSRTVCMTQLQVKAEERDIEKFVSAVCNVKRVNLIRDRNTGRSKNIAYIELKTVEDVPLALMLSGQKFVFHNGKTGFPIHIKVSEAEKNFTHRMEKREKQASTNSREHDSCKLVLSCIDQSVTEEQLRDICEEYGNVIHLELPRSSITGLSRAFAWVTYSTMEESRNAMLALRKRPINGVLPSVKMSHSQVNDAPNAGISSKEAWRLDDDHRGGASGISMTAETRVNLMSKLAGGTGNEILSSMMTSNSNSTATDQKPPVQEDDGIIGAPSQYLMIQNMFDPASETEPTWVEDIEADLVEECSRYGAVVSVKIDKFSQGNGFVKFENISDATKAATAIHGRWFDRRQLVVSYLTSGSFTAYSAAIDQHR